MSKNTIGKSGCGGGLYWTDLSIQVGGYEPTISTNTTARTTTPSACISDNIRNKPAATVKPQKKKNRVLLVNPCTGHVPPGTLCAILGPSGAGKTMFLTAIAGGLPPSCQEDDGNNKGGGGGGGGPSYAGTIRLGSSHDNNYGSQQNIKVAWLSQHDHFFEMLTVQETLDLAAFLEDDGHAGRQQREQLVNDMLKQLGLWHVRNRRVGQADDFTNTANDSSSSSTGGRLSGGERRRLSLGLELVANPQLFVGDEPTTGLDSSMSEHVIKLIQRHVVQQQIPGVLSLHQPRSSIWQQLDYLLLMASGGHVIYFGPRRKAVDYFANLGYACPQYTNPAEYFLDLISITQSSLDEKNNDVNGCPTDDDNNHSTNDDRTPEERVAYLREAFVKYQSRQTKKQQQPQKEDAPGDSPATRQGKSTTRGSSKVYSPNLLERFRRLLMRSWRQNIRDHKLNMVRLVVSVGNAFLFGTVFKVPQPIRGQDNDNDENYFYYNSKTIPDRTGLLCMGVVNMCMLTVMKTMDLLAKEKPVVLREQRRNQYSSFEYLLSKSLAEMPLDMMFAVLFAVVIKTQNGLRIPLVDLTMVFAIMTICGASLGLCVGAWSSSQEVSMAVGVPLMIILLSVGMMTQGDLDNVKEESLLVQALQSISPMYYANKAVCLQEYQGMLFHDPSGSSSNGHNNKLRFVWDVLRGKRPDMTSMVQTGDEIIQELGIADAKFDECIQRLVLLSILFLVMSWIGLVLQTSSSSKRKN